MAGQSAIGPGRRAEAGAGVTRTLREHGGRVGAERGFAALGSAAVNNASWREPAWRRGAAARGPPVEPPPAEQWVLVPDVRRRPLMDGVQRARAARLRLEVSGGWPSAPERAVVYEQQPAPETRVRIGSTLTVQITPPQVATPPPATPPPSSPPPSTPPPSPPPPRVTPPRPELVLVPDLRQQPLPEARQLTLSARLELRVRGQVPADETHALVVSKRPEPGTRVALRSAVLAELGPALFAIPHLPTQPLVD